VIQEYKAEIDRKKKTAIPGSEIEWGIWDALKKLNNYFYKRECLFALPYLTPILSQC